MYRLLTLLSSYRNAILFVVLELVAFFLIINNNNRQRHLMGDALFDMTSSMSQSKGSVRQYFDLREQNEDLRQRSTDLEKKLDEAEKKIQAYEALLALDTLPKMSIDSLLSHESYIYIPARVIKNTIHKNYNYFTVNKGRLDGVVEGMGVVSPQGVAGKVIDMGDHYSLGLSALNVSFKLTLQAIDASGESFEGNIGIYEWKGGDPRYADLTYIPETVSLQEGFA
ncbi:MAG: rod shape-determining protein MreC, partial [Bacteroidota bacterium]